MPLNRDDVATIRDAIKEELTTQLVPVHDKLDGLAKSIADLRGEKYAHQASHDRHERWIQINTCGRWHLSIV